MTFCVSSLATTTSAHGLLDGHPEFARQLDNDALDRFFGQGSSPREGWLYKTAHEAWLAIAYTPFGHGACQVVVREADAEPTKSALIEAVNNYARLVKAKLENRPRKRETINAMPTDTLGWEMTLPDTHRTAIIASIADQPVGNKQTLMSFVIEH